jgi:hypothetical protein
MSFLYIYFKVYVCKIMRLLLNLKIFLILLNYSLTNKNRNTSYVNNARIFYYYMMMIILYIYYFLFVCAI